MRTHVQGSQRKAHGMGEGAQDRAEEDAKEDSRFRQRPTEGGFGLIASGTLWKASYASESGAKEWGFPTTAPVSHLLGATPRRRGGRWT